VKDAENKLRPMSQPGPLTDLVGATVDQHESLPRRLETTTVRRVGDPTDDSEGSRRRPSRSNLGGWLDPDAAEPQYAYDVDGPADGRPAVVTNTVGDGQVTYCGVWPSLT